MTVELDDVTVRRGGFSLRISTAFAAGAITAVLGPNGSGKSTLLRAVAGLEAVDEGRIAINGRTVDSTHGARGVFQPPHRRRVGVVFQDYALFPHLSVLENVAFGPRSRGQRRGAARAEASRQLDRMGVAELVGRRPAQISGGQAQRVALARALVGSPEVLLLDEPLAALDVEARDAVRTELAARLRDFPGAVLLVTHDPLDAVALAGRVLVLESGVAVQDGTPAELLASPATGYVRALVAQASRLGASEI